MTLADRQDWNASLRRETGKLSLKKWSKLNVNAHLATRVTKGVREEEDYRGDPHLLIFPFFDILKKMPNFFLAELTYIAK